MAERRIKSEAVDFVDRRVGDRRKCNRRASKASSTHDFPRMIKEKNLYPYEREYDRPEGDRIVYQGKKLINLASVDYFNFSQHPEVKKAACEAVDLYGAGALSSRYSLGYLAILKDLENEIARFMGAETILLFNSGYLANLAVIDSLTGRDATIFMDQHSHISLYHACKLSGKKHYRYANNNMEHLEKLLREHRDAPNKWIVTLGVFSSTGVLGNLKDIAALGRKYKARIFMDDAHGVGVYGKDSRGVADLFGVYDEIDLLMCSFQMAFGNIGAFVTGRTYILQPAHVETLPYIFTFALPPVSTAAIAKALAILQEEKERLKDRLWENVRFLRKQLIDIGYKVINPESHITSLVTGDELKTCEFTDFMLRKGVWVQPYFHPFAPKGKGIVRVTCTSNHTRKVLQQSVPAFKEAITLL